jgi:hypothetical protein
MDHEEFDALLGPLQRHNQREGIAKTNKELQEISSRLAKTEKEENSLPQCPYCGGRIPVGFAKCKNCASDLIWFHGFPGKVGEEIYLQRRVLKLEQEQAAQKRAAQQKSTMKSNSGPVEHPLLDGLKFASLLIILIIVIFGGAYLLTWLEWI